VANLTPDCTEDCDWEYYAGDFSVGEPSYWKCNTCGREDVDREPPEDDYDYYYYYY
jgi:hypothetical protein